MSDGTVTLFIAMSVDGYIADANGGVSWLAEFEAAADDDHHDDYAAFFENVDCLVMGATTYEQILSFDGWPYEDKPTYVFTHRDLPAATDAVEFVDRPVAAASTDLKERYSHIWLVGGAQLTRAFLGEQEIDESVSLSCQFSWVVAYPYLGASTRRSISNCSMPRAPTLASWNTTTKFADERGVAWSDRSGYPD